MSETAIQYVNGMLSEFGAERGMANAALSADGAYTMKRPDGLRLELELTGEVDTQNWTCAVAHPPHGDREAYYGRLLEWNFQGELTDGAALALDAPADEVVLRYSQSVATLTSASFANITENFLAAAERVRKELKSPGQQVNR